MHALLLFGLLPSARVCATPFAADMRTKFANALAAFDEAQGLQTDHPDRARQLFRLAAQRFDSIIASGVVNGRLEFNSGNCYLQAGDLGNAILHYRRAQRLIPGDELLADNLGVARKRCLTTIQSTRRSAFLRNLFFWHYQTSVAGRTKVALLLYVAVWGLLMVRNFLPRRAVTVSVIACAVLAAGAGVSVASTRWSDRNAPDGVVTAMDVVAHKGPGTAYQRQFEQPLQPGVEFTLRERRGDWHRIELADGKSGWIEAADAKIVLRHGERQSRF
jgi:hypothetical protein